MDTVDVEERIQAMLRRGEAASARALLVAEYDSAVGSLCRGMVRDPRLAEDLKQDVFVRALENLETHRGEGTLRAWLLRIARNHCLDHIRRKKVVAIGLVDPDEAPDAGAGELTEVVAGLQRAELALEVLTPDDRALVLLHHVQGVEYAELAVTFGVSEGALRMRMKRALDAMRQDLERLDRRDAGRRRVTVTRFALWASLTAAIVGGAYAYVWTQVIRPQQEAAASLAAELEEMRAEAETAQRQLAAARQSGASEEELQRLRDQLALTAANQQAAASGDTESAERTVRRSSSSTTGARRLPDGGVTSSSSGSCGGPLCGLMRSP